MITLSLQGVACFAQGGQGDALDERDMAEAGFAEAVVDAALGALDGRGRGGEQAARGRVEHAESRTRHRAGSDLCQSK